MTTFFAAANTEMGFHSLFPSYFAPEAHRRIYILKGGPGTGKSTLMKQVGFAAEANGYTVEYLYCSSDTDSLDGIRIPALGIAILDGTAPHTTDPKYPGAVERIVNLGEAFDGKGLEKERNTILSLSKAKGDAYRTAYRFLAAAGRMAHERDDLLIPAFLSGKAEAAVLRLSETLKKAEKGEETYRYISAIGTRGYVKLDTLRKKAKKVYAVSEKNGLEYLFMKHLHAALLRAGVAMMVCSTPLVDSHIEAVYIESEGVLFAVTEESAIQPMDKIINSARFAQRDALAQRRAKLRFTEKCMKGLMEGALSSLREAGRVHGKLEEIYGKNMDFSAVESMKNRIVSEIFANNM